MIAIINKYSFVFFLIASSICYGQKVTVSNEINVRNNYSYEVLPNIGDHILFYHDRGFEQNFELFDQNLRYKTARQPEFEKKNIRPIGITPLDSSFNFYYTYKDEGVTYVRVNQYDKYISMIGLCVRWLCNVPSVLFD